jgi:hypothetical protein
MPGDVVLSNPDTMAAPGGHYSHAVSANGFVFVSGQLPIAPDGTKLNDAPFEQQARQVLDNVAHALIAAGSAVSRLVQVRVYVTDIAYWTRLQRDLRRVGGSGASCALRGAGACAALRLQDRGRGGHARMAGLRAAIGGIIDNFYHLAEG